MSRNEYSREHLHEYLTALQEGMLLNSTSVQMGRGVEAQKGRKYTKVVLTEHGRAVSVHAFIDQDGQLIKAAGFNQPQRNSDGTLAVRYDLTDDTVRGELCELLRTNPSAQHGGYLYLQK